MNDFTLGTTRAWCPIQLRMGEQTAKLVFGCAQALHQRS